MTITANRWGWRHSPCVLVCRRHIPEMAWEKVNEAPAWPERLQNRIPREVRGGDQWWCRGPFCRPGLVCASWGHVDSCLCIRSHQPSTLTFSFTLTRNQFLPSSLSSEASQAQWESLASGSCPLYYAATTSPPPLLLSLWPLFWQDTGCQLQL